jgi:hypothetical protein
MLNALNALSVPLVIFLYTCVSFVVASGWAVSARGDWAVFVKEFDRSPATLFSIIFWPLALPIVIPFVVLKYGVFKVIKRIDNRLKIKSHSHDIDRLITEASYRNITRQSER